jgi:hypothetical protein
MTRDNPLIFHDFVKDGGRHTGFTDSRGTFGTPELGDGVALTSMAHPDGRREKLLEMIDHRISGHRSYVAQRLADDILIWMDGLLEADISEDALETIEIEVADR